MFTVQGAVREAGDLRANERQESGPLI